MARIGDTPEQQRINELNEAQRRIKVDKEKKTDQARRGAAFNEVMTQQAQRDQRKKGLAKKAGKQQAEAKGQEQEVATRKRAAPKKRADINRKQALARASRQGMVKGRGKAQKADKAQEQDRVSELDVHRSDELEHVDREVRHEEREDKIRSEERQDVIELNVDPDAQGQQRQQQQRREGGSQDQSQQGADNISAASAKGAGGATKIPQAMLEQIAKAIAVAAAADGRTEVHVALHGSMLEGVTLKVGIKKGGKVRCSFSGCDKTTKNLLESSKGDLMRALSKRGLELDFFKVT